MPFLIFCGLSFPELTPGFEIDSSDLFLVRSFRMNTMKKYTFCQSCGFPLRKDKKGGGTEKDGSINKKYCSMCYENGVFLTPPEVDSAEKMQQYCIEELRKDGMNRIFAWLATRSISKLERWKK